MDTHEISVRALLRGDRQTAASFYRVYAPKLLAFIQKKVQNDRDCEEILQDTLFAFLEAIRDFQGTSNIRTYLYAICQHKIVDYYRKKKITHLVFSRVPTLENIISPLLSPEEQFDAVTVKVKIQKTLQRLIPQYREMLTLKYLDGMGVSEIARKFSITLKSVEMKLFRARKAFVEAFISI